MQLARAHGCLHASSAQSLTDLISTALDVARRMIHRSPTSHTIYDSLSKLTMCGHDMRSPMACCGSLTCKLMW